MVIIILMLLSSPGSMSVTWLGVPWYSTSVYFSSVDRYFTLSFASLRPSVIAESDCFHAVDCICTAVVAVAMVEEGRATKGGGGRLVGGGAVQCLARLCRSKDGDQKLALLLLKLLGNIVESRHTVPPVPATPTRLLPSKITRPLTWCRSPILATTHITHGSPSPGSIQWILVSASTQNRHKSDAHQPMTPLHIFLRLASISTAVARRGLLELRGRADIIGIAARHVNVAQQFADLADP